MPTVDIALAPSRTSTRVAVWMCRLCGAAAQLIDNTGSAVASIEYFIDNLGWAQIGGDEVVCNRCKLHPDITNLLLARSKARTQ